MTTGHRRPRQQGQALAEMGFVILLFVVLMFGIIDLGRMLMVLNVITHAARDGARMAAVTPPDRWGAEATLVQDRVKDQIATVTTSEFDVTPSCSVVNGRPSVSVTVKGSEPYLFNFSSIGLWGGEVEVTRVATFRYEGLQTECPS